MELDMLISSSLSDAKWLIANGDTDSAVDRMARGGRS